MPDPSPTGALSLKVAEASQRDFGRGIARIDPADMEKMGVRTGDIVALAGGRRTVARAMPAYHRDRGRGAIQVDGIVRNNAQVGIDDTVRVERGEAGEAEEVTLAPLEARQQGDLDRYAEYARRLLKGLPMVDGDRVRLSLLGTSTTFALTRVRPKLEAAVIGPLTRVKIHGRAAGGRSGIGVTYGDIGGLGEQIQRVREMIELPLRHPEVFAHLGIEPPRGVLLHGPPGTGKTLIARAVANETFAAFVSISGPEVHGRFYGESEARLREVFAQARQSAPCIVFIDELDAIAPSREEVTGEVEKRVVSQLLALMDGLDPRGQVVVIGATNRPNALDPALRRGGRFDREIEVGVPTADGRLEILGIHVRGMPLTGDVDLAKLAEATHGFTGADLAGLTREAAMRALRRVIPEIDFEADSVPAEVLDKLVVTRSDFVDALRLVEPSAMREIYVEAPNVAWDDIGGLKELKQELREAIEWPLRHEELFEKAGATPPRGILLCGPPGSGKTLLAKAVAHESGVNFINIRGPELMSRFVGESERGVRKTFRRARQVAPCIIFFDEIDAMAPRRGSGTSDAHASERVISQLLTEMDGLEELHGVIVLAATNRRDLLDPALLRPGRFDLIMHLPRPDAEARREIFAVHTRGRPVADEVSLDELAAETEGFEGADVAAVCRDATMAAIRGFLNPGVNGDVDQFKISMAHFRAALERVRQRRGGGSE